ncbi:Lipopolysaccharide core biosynthesis protein RfaG [Planctomycetes bacterium Pan216]|uniref:Lipopolysaccharide core biosynthesis protein RfaG n=1 Tax=Kolteria novifilia TaxID=2527975 RepID=A0A518AYM5_9BACT|nr:Lipopolysaccharide core biosynthesis protein RfaG [Planctomycetes bacterium Pan216]
MRIALVIGRYNATGGGAERWTDRHARWLLAHGHDVHLVSGGFSGLPEGATAHEVTVARRCAKPRLAFAEKAEEIVRRGSFDVVHDMGDGWTSDLFMPHHGTRRGGFEQNSLLVPRWLRPTRGLARQLLPRYREFDELESRQYEPVAGRLFVALSHMVREHMMGYYGVAEEQIRIVPNGVDPNRFHPDEHGETRARMRRELAVEDAVVYLLIAHNFRLKGLDPLLEALATLRSRGRSAVVVVVGAGRVAPYQRMADRLGILDAVRFAGSRDDALPYYQAADVYVQPTYYDPCSLVVLEALACGLPVVTTRHNGAGELMEPGVSGAVIETPTDVRGLAEAMDSFHEEEVRRVASVAARCNALENTIDHNAERLLSLYGDVAGRRACA